MPRENVEVVRQAIAGFNRDGLLPEELFDPDIEFFNFRESPLPGPYRGYEGLREWREGVFEVIEEGHFVIDEVVDETNPVVYRMRLVGRAKHTGIEMELPSTAVMWLRAGRIYRSESFTDHDEALEAARRPG